MTPDDGGEGPGELDFGGGDAPEPTEPTNLIPFPNVRPNAKVGELWAREREQTKYKFTGPFDALDALIRKRGLPTLPWPETWPELAKRCRLYAGECVGVVGPTGGGKSSFSIQVGIAATGRRIPVLWAALELDPVEIDLRIVANVTRTHTARIREEWTREQIAHVLASVEDLWRFVDRFRDPERQIEAFRHAVRSAKKIYRVPPLLIIDYIGKMSSCSRDPRLATREHAEMIRELTLDEECYTMILAQPSRANNATLTGKIELGAASDAVGVAGESGEIEHACSVMIGLNVFKLDDTSELDAHALISKARGSGYEGRQGFRFSKPGGVWSELGYLPATPKEIATEVKRAKKDKHRVEPVTPASARTDVNATRSSEAEAARRQVVQSALVRAGTIGLSESQLRTMRGTGDTGRLKCALGELERQGEIERLFNGNWRIPR